MINSQHLKTQSIPNNKNRLSKRCINLEIITKSNMEVKVPPVSFVRHCSKAQSSAKFFTQLCPHKYLKMIRPLERK